MKPATYDETIAWQDYYSHFEACADLNIWKEKSNGTYLAVSLRSNALGICQEERHLNIRRGSHLKVRQSSIGYI